MISVKKEQEMQKLNNILKFIGEWDEFEENGIKVDEVVDEKDIVQQVKKMKPEYEKKLKEIQQKRVNWKRDAEEFLTRNNLIIAKSIILRREPQAIKILCDKIYNGDA